ncbi:hypothetical protein L873DRAFT_1827510 [Choiromyces venosus 120613-1]|uniref:CAP-Gly domain-containing protein n=1 Tax=Choiromyces venosus 120613-1 TaxID=1336337 RepID=A0A3N4JUJ1_9PEZI|nr:hypothetical protein L873DRAFT_1827510 [Choiromyces venosus 120613-1]
MLARKASLNQLTQNSLASIPDGTVGYGLGSPTRATRDDYRGQSTPIGADVEVGDAVNTPNGMHGTVKFIGNVKGKAGIFVGVELDPDMSGRGKNDGAVDGVRYFTTAQLNSGIFVPLARATKRHSASSSNPPPTPTLLSLPSPTGPSQLTPPTPSRNRPESPAHRFANGIGKAPTTRPSLPRPESPMRRGTPGPGSRPGLHPPITPRNISSAAGGRFGAPSPTPGKLSYNGRARASSIASTVGDGRPGTSGGGAPPLRLAQTPSARAPYSLGLKQPKSTMGLSQMVRTGSSMGMRSISSLDRHMEEHHETSPIDSGIGMNRSEDLDNSAATSLLESKLAEKDEQLKEQAAALLEMEASFTELQSLVQNASSPQMSHFASPTIPTRSGSFEDADATQLRALLREKNEKIQLLTAEFDAHRADFRSTIDTLELASTETERVYEKRVDDLTAEIRELQDRNDDVESVARQLKQLEELVAELEEGLEDARRGEAEARGEVEFLRGEVERSREELRREKEKNAAAVANAAVGKMMRSGSNNDEVEKRDDEIRGLKAIIHSLSRDTISADDGMNGDYSHLDGLGAARRLGSNGEVEELAKERMSREKLEKEVGELGSLIERRAAREEELEKEIELLKKRKETRSSITNNSEKTVTGWVGRERRDSGKDSRATIGSWRSKHQPTSSAASSLLQQPAPPPPGSSSLADDLSATGSGGLTPITAEDSESADGSVLWCEICETAGHDILTCTNMFGSAAGGPASAGPEGEKTAAAAQEEEAEEDVKSLHVTSPVMEWGASSSSAFPESSTDDDADFKSAVWEKKKRIHLPAPPPMVEGSFGPVAGKETGVIDMNKWCALCERDGHESFDCPLETDF